MNKPSKQELTQFIKDNNVTSYKQLMDQYNVPRSTISHWLTSYSIRLSDFQEKINKPSKQELIKFIKDNNVTSYKPLAEHYNVTKSRIGHWFESYSIKLSDFQEKINKPSKDELIKFIKDNNSSLYKQLAEHFNVTESKIGNWLKSYSMKLSDYKSNKPSKQELIQFIKDNNGSSYNQLADQFNVTESKISRWFASYSIRLYDFQEKTNKPSKQELINFIKNNNGASRKHLMSKYNVSESKIAYWLTSYSIKLSDFQEKANKPYKQELIQFIKNNSVTSYKQLMDKYNVSESKIAYWLRSYSIRLYDFQEKTNKPSRQELIQFIKNNSVTSYKELESHFNVNKGYINRWLKSYSMKLSDFQNETIFYHKDQILNLSDNPHKNHISIKDLDYEKVVLLIKGNNPVVYVEKEGKGKTTTPKALIEEYIRKRN